MTVKYPRIAGAYLTAIIPTLVAYYLLDANEGIAALMIYAAATVTIGSARSVIRSAPWRISGTSGEIALERKLGLRIVEIALTWIELLFHLFGAAVIAVSLNLTPASAYIAWFGLVQDGDAAGVLSLMFTVKICFFATVAAGAMLRRNPVAAVMIAIALSCMIFYAIFQIQNIMIAAIAVATCAAIASVVGRPSRRSVRRVVTFVQIFIIAGLVSYPLSLTKPGVFNPLVSILSHKPLAELVVRVYPEFPFLYNMPGFGHQLGERELGGQPTLTERPVFRITGRRGETVYLRTAVYEIYTGKGWAQVTTRLDRAARATGVFSIEDPSTYERPLKIEILIDFFSSVPHTADTASINFYEGDFPPLKFGDFDTGFVFEFPIVSGTTFYLDRKNDIDRGLPNNLGGYLQLPGEIPDEVRELAGYLSADDSLRTSENIKMYLASNYLYSLDSFNAPRDADPAWSFLMNGGSGYCVHFATAFALLARMSGIPARYVSGFLVHIPRDSETVSVPGYASHAWVEIWTPERGWTVVEADPPMSPEFFDDPMYYELYNPFGGSYTGRQLEMIMGDRIPSRPERQGPRIPDVDPKPFLYALAGILVIVVTTSFFLFSSHAPVGKRRKFRTAVRVMLRRSYRAGAVDPELSGWIEWRQSLEQTEAADAARTAVPVLQRVFFAGDPVSMEYIRHIRAAARSIRRGPSRHGKTGVHKTGIRRQSA